MALKNQLVEGITQNSSNLFHKISRSNDPLRELGPGISTYHQLLVMLFALFTILSLLHIPVLRSFLSYEFYDSNQGWIAGSSIGNMGFSKTECQTSSMIHGNSHQLKCSSGVLSELVDWGITTHFEDNAQCTSKPTNFCYSVLNDKLVRERYKSSCANKTSCTLNDLH
jgi:hypothetical protein